MIIRGRDIRFLMYVLIVSVPLFLEHVGETPSRDPTRPPEQALSRFVLGAPIGYQDVMRLGFRRPMPHLVQIVALGENTSRISLCAGRLLLARLLEKIEDQRPSLIVLDYYFPDSCPPGDPGTEALQKAITTSKIPIVVGLGTYTPSEYEQAPQGGEGQKAKPLVSESQFQAARRARLVLRGEIRFITSSQADMPGKVMIANAGLLSVPSEIRHIPLRWPVYDVQPNGDLGDVRLVRSLSLTAAEIYEREISNGFVSSRLNDLVEAGTFPYISNFVPEKSSGAENGIPVTDAVELLCGRSPQVGDWTHCDSKIGGKLVSAAPIVIVGERGSLASSDLFATPVGLMYGATLQANYIEALLEERYITPLSQRATLILNIVWVLLVELIFFFWPRRALKYSLLASVAILAVTYFVLLEWGLFLVLWTLVLAIFSPVIRAFEEVKHILVHS